MFFCWAHGKQGAEMTLAVEPGRLQWWRLIYSGAEGMLEAKTKVRRLTAWSSSSQEGRLPSSSLLWPQRRPARLKWEC